ncbi:hypothetical protein PSECIP111854_02051 [Pseudoalteromonas sp. CIP111854]|uniref:Uncharacterized protein n=1 Tax=Pseudoalteromonas holothuriae TaxID=2963714 RepID=A0A9W4QY04_9GAMM|nr:hypothetical protein [Pseudoalteromonas sp. CIP111854]CAH9057705.1 hypothetical protein PSECIP111854_02051 [Pseudoalteromonas sp. CIP111854]
MTILTDKVSSSSSGFVDGEFPSATSQLLPWPEATQFGTFMDVHGYSGGVNYAIPNPYDETGGYIHTNYSNVTYYNADGTARWSKTAHNMHSGCKFYGFPHVVHMINGVPHLVGILQHNVNSGDYYVYKINLNTAASGSGIVLTNNSGSALRPVNMGILENDQLFVTVSDSGTNVVSYLCDLDGMTFVSRLNVGKTGVVIGINNSKREILHGAALFKGSVTVSFVSGGQSGGNSGAMYDIFSFIIGVNRALDFSGPSPHVENIRTEHGPALNNFVGYLRQVSKDLFMVQGSKESSQGHYAYWRFGHNRRMYFTRSALEEWVKNCVYAQTGLRIGE